ncbi:MAG: hypothetical protein KJO21_08430 [Verrucomicrobiae bacterium]|nr:hypothetical protein [Verrucomicrobiae bacterium]NNJ43499.1 hypothetical protein [Akkermansiaceae bacterium]
MKSNTTNPHQRNENYSVDEMMSRLKRNDRQKQSSKSDISSSDPDKNGELITREDGSQVIKVRNRKRRSQQRKKKVSQSKTSPQMKWAILGSLMGILVILTAGTIFIIAKYNGRNFKESTEATISQLSNAQTTTLTQLRVTPISAKATKAELLWDQHSFMRSASFNGIYANILATSFFSNEWIGEEVVARLGKVYLQTPSPNRELLSEVTLSPYQFGTFRCNKLDLHFGQDKDAPAITGLQVALRQQVDERYQIVFQGGLMKIKNWPSLEISSGIVTLNDQGCKIEALLEAGDAHKGALTIKGRIAKNTSRSVLLDVQAKDYPIEELLGKALGRLLRGEIRSDMGSLSYDYTKQAPDTLSFIMPFNSTELHLSELPFLSELKNLTGDTQYVRPIFNHCTGTIMRTSEGVNIDNLNFTSTGVLTIKGKLAVNAQDILSGDLKVGIPARLFSKKFPPPSLFSEPHNGFIFTQVTLSGSIHNPHDNLHELLQASVTPSRQTPASQAEKNEIKEKEFEILTR